MKHSNALRQMTWSILSKEARAEEWRKEAFKGRNRRRSASVRAFERPGVLVDRRQYAGIHYPRAFESWRFASCLGVLRERLLFLRRWVAELSPFKELSVDERVISRARFHEANAARCSSRSRSSLTSERAPQLRGL